MAYSVASLSAPLISGSLDRRPRLLGIKATRRRDLEHRAVQLGWVVTLAEGEVIDAAGELLPHPGPVRERGQPHDRQRIYGLHVHAQVPAVEVALGPAQGGQAVFRGAALDVHLPGEDFPLPAAAIHGRRP